MARRSGQPALYEMMRSPRGAGGPTSDPAPMHMPPPSADVGEEPGSSPVLMSLARLLTPGQTIRMPVGYLMLAIAMGIVLLLAAYLIGNSRGKAVAEQNFAQKLSSTPTRSGAVNDPLSQPADLTAGSALLSSAQPDDSAASSERPGGGVRPAAQWGPIEPKTDPRVKGWKYYVLAQTSPQGAVRLAEFCRANGLETYVVRGKNGLHWVVAFPGFQGSSAAPEPAALLERIEAIGVKYKAHTKGRTNLGVAVPDLYGG
jgi:hypothetical protein